MSKYESKIFMKIKHYGTTALQHYDTTALLYYGIKEESKKNQRRVKEESKGKGTRTSKTMFPSV